MTLDKAKKTAQELSVKNWNRYYHVHATALVGDYRVDQYHSEDAEWYYIKGNEYKH